jgi:hypothetical protein
LLGVISLLSCSEIHEPLDWKDAARAGLGEVPDTVVSDTLVVESDDFSTYVSTGSSSYFLAGKLTRSEARMEAHAYLKWDLTDLPDGSITSASVQLVLRGVDEGDSSVTGPYELWMYELAEEWTEGTLDTLPERGTFVAGSGTITTGGASDTSDVLLTDLFDDPDLADLVDRWRDDDSTNYGVVLIPTDDSEEGFLRFISSEGTPQGYVTSDLSTPALVVTVNTAGVDTITTHEAVDDAYIVDVPAGDPAPADSLLLVSSGYVRRSILRLDLASLRASDPERFPVGIAVHSAALRLELVRDHEWSLGAGEQLTLRVYQTDEPWAEGVPPEVTSASLVSAATVAGEDSTAVFSIRGPIQEMFEGSSLSLVLQCETEVGRFRSLLFKGCSAVEGKPQVEMMFSRPGDGRLGPWP